MHYWLHSGNLMPVWLSIRFTQQVTNDRSDREQVHVTIHTRWIIPLLIPISRLSWSTDASDSRCSPNAYRCFCFLEQLNY